MHLHFERPSLRQKMVLISIFLKHSCNVGNAVEFPIFIAEYPEIPESLLKFNKYIGTLMDAKIIGFALEYLYNVGLSWLGSYSMKYRFYPGPGPDPCHTNKTMVAFSTDNQYICQIIRFSPNFAFLSTVTPLDQS